MHLLFQAIGFNPNKAYSALHHFKSNFWAAMYLILGLLMAGYFFMRADLLLQTN